MLGSTVMWFARDWDAPGQPYRPPDEWPSRALASISTHDLPTAYGFLSGEHVRMRAELKLLATGGAAGEAAEHDRAADDRAQLIVMLRRVGLLGRDPTDDDVVAAMHAALAGSPSRLAAVALPDVLGEVRQANVPGTIDEYPNWRLPLPASLEVVASDARVLRVVGVFEAARPRRRGRAKHA
jgi:4-alpha-glucanotransferase